MSIEVKSNLENHGYLFKLWPSSLVYLELNQMNEDGMTVVSEFIELVYEKNVFSAFNNLEKSFMDREEELGLELALVMIIKLNINILCKVW